MLQQQCQGLPQRAELARRHGSREQFLKHFNPSMQRSICDDVADCLFGDYPVLAQLKEYGKNTPAMWLLPQLYNLSEYCGCKEKLTGESLEECAFLIASEYYYMKVSEMMLFFHRFKLGRYGRFYGSVDPMVIMEALMEFARERRQAYEQKENKEKQERMEESRGQGVSYEQYLAIRKRAEMGDHEAIELLKKH